MFEDMPVADAVAEKLRESQAEAEEAAPLGHEMLSDWPEGEATSDLLQRWEEDAAVEEEEPEGTAVPPPLPPADIQVNQTSKWLALRLTYGAPSASIDQFVCLFVKTQHGERARWTQPEKVRVSVCLSVCLC